MPRTKKTEAKPKATARTARKATVAPQPQSTREQLSSIIKSARDLMRKDAGLSGDLDRLPQLSWVLFLKCYDDMEQRREDEAILSARNTGR
jgi:type I restriction enzyme M protein